MKKSALAVTVLLAVMGSVVGGDTPPTRVGETVPLMFHSIAVTGPRRGTDVCWV